MRVIVTQSDIDGAVRGGYLAPCPIARALRRATGHNWRVSARDLAVRDSGLKRFMTLPPEAGDFIRRWEAGETVVPFSFVGELEAA